MVISGKAIPKANNVITIPKIPSVNANNLLESILTSLSNAAPTLLRKSNGELELLSVTF